MTNDSPARKDGQWTKVLLACTVIMASMTAAGCLDGDDDNDDRIGVIVTIVPQIEFAERVGGDRVKVTVMVPEGESPHAYAPTTGQMKDVASAELYFKVGSGLEFETAWMDTLEEQNDDMLIVDGSADIELIPFDTGHDIEDDADELFEHGPYTAVATGENESAAPAVDGGGMCYNLSFNEDEGNWSGVVRFTPDEDGKFVIFLEHDAEELGFVVKDEEGNEVEHEVEAATRHDDGHDDDRGHEHPFEWHVSLHLHAENYTLEFGPTDEETCQMVILEHHDDHDLGALDPHIWNSPKNARIMVQNFLEGLKQVDPDNSDYYTENANVYMAELDALITEMENGLAPHRGEKFMVYHPSFGYLAHDFCLEQIAIEDEGKEPTAAGLQALIDQAKEEGITVVFVSPQFDKSNAESIADEIDGEVVFIDPLGANYIENMRVVKTKLIEGLE